jgi:uncharacterized protein (TIGR00299 family) protein
MIAHLDPVGGASGDMFLGALVSAGVPFEELQRALGGLTTRGCRLVASHVRRCEVPATRVEVQIDAHHKEPHGRTLTDILDLLGRLDLHPEDRTRSAEVFRQLARAESRVHHENESRVHFHEVGALDAIADIVGTVAGFRLLGVTQVTTGPLPLGHGVIESAHGVLPNPAPATQELLSGLSVLPVDEASELVTPTGAALVSYLTGGASGEAVSMRFLRAGAGAGARELRTRPNVLRILLGEPLVTAAPEEQGVVVLRSTVDSATPEIHGYLVETLLEKGALEAYHTPVVMKKGRPAVQVTVLAPEDKWEELAQTILIETGSLGLRVTRERRLALPRRIESVPTPWGEARVKVARLGDGPERAAVEYEDARLLARASGLPLREVMRIVLDAYLTRRPRCEENAGGTVPAARRSYSSKCS